MVEGGANEVSEDIMLGALEKAQGFITAMCELQEQLVEVLHVIIDPGARYRGFIQVLRAPDRAVQRVIQVGHDAQ